MIIATTPWLTRAAYIYVSPLTEEAWICELAETNPKLARAMYLDHYKRSPTDRSLLAEIDDLLKEAFLRRGAGGADLAKLDWKNCLLNHLLGRESEKPPGVMISPELLLAMQLWRQGHGQRGRPANADLATIFDDVAVDLALKLKADGLTAEKAVEVALSHVKKRPTISATTILDRLSPGRKRREFQLQHFRLSKSESVKY
jgi:hypothetical protein